MIKDASSKRILTLLELFYSNAFRSLVKHPFFKKKRNRYMTCTMILILYFAYFYFNMVELAKISMVNQNISLAVIVKGQMTTFFSACSSAFFFGVILYLFVVNTVALDKVSLFFAKSLPFEENEIQLSFLIFKFSIMISLYEFIMLIITPMMTLVTSSKLLFVLIWLILQTIFILTCICLDFLYKKMPTFTKGKSRLIVKYTADIILLVSALLYYFLFRYKLEEKLSGLTTHISVLIGIVCLSVLLLLFLSLLLIRKFIFPEQILTTSKYIKIGPTIKNLLSSNLISLFRTKNNWYVLFLMIAFVVILYVSQDFKQLQLILQMILVFSGVFCLPFYDNMSRFRRLFTSYSISLKRDIGYQLMMLIILVLPNVIVSYDNYLNLLQSVWVALTSLILGYLFPKSDGILNETTQMIILAMTIMICFILSKKPELTSFIIITQLCLFAYVIKKERAIGEK